MMFSGEIEQGVEIFDCLEKDVSASAAVSAVGPALGDILLPSEAEAPVATIACFNPDFCLIYEHNICLGHSIWKSVLGKCIIRISYVGCGMSYPDVASGFRDSQCRMLCVACSEERIVYGRIGWDA